MTLLLEQAHLSLLLLSHLSHFSPAHISPVHMSSGHVSPVSPALTSPGHAAVVAHPAVLFLVVAAAGLADEHVTVQTLAFAVDQELEGLQAADTQRAAQVVLRSQQLSLRVLLLDLSLQLSATTTTDED